MVSSVCIYTLAATLNECAPFRETPWRNSRLQCSLLLGTRSCDSATTSQQDPCRDIRSIHSRDSIDGVRGIAVAPSRHLLTVLDVINNVEDQNILPRSTSYKWPCSCSCVFFCCSPRGRAACLWLGCLGTCAVVMSATGAG